MEYLKPAAFCIIPLLGAWPGVYVTRINMKPWYQVSTQKYKIIIDLIMYVHLYIEVGGSARACACMCALVCVLLFMPCKHIARMSIYTTI